MKAYRYYVSSCFTRWREVSKEEYEKVTEYVRTHTPAIPTERKAEIIARYAKKVAV